MRTRYTIAKFGIVLEDDTQILESLHVSKMVDSEEYSSITQQRDALMERIEKFLLKQEKAGLLKPYVVGSCDGAEVYPGIAL